MLGCATGTLGVGSHWCRFPQCLVGRFASELTGAVLLQLWGSHPCSPGVRLMIHDYIYTLIWEHTPGSMVDTTILCGMLSHACEQHWKRHLNLPLASKHYTAGASYLETSPEPYCQQLVLLYRSKPVVLNLSTPTGLWSRPSPYFLLGLFTPNFQRDFIHFQ